MLITVAHDGIRDAIGVNAASYCVSVVKDVPELMRKDAEASQRHLSIDDATGGTAGTLDELRLDGDHTVAPTQGSSALSI